MLKKLLGIKTFSVKDQKLFLLEKASKEEFVETILDSVLFVPMLQGKISE